MSYASALGAPFTPQPVSNQYVAATTQHTVPAPGPVSQTRVLTLAGFSPSLKTRDIQAVFAEWEDDRGGFKIKWIDDTSCYIVFADALTCKRAFLTTLANMPMALIDTPGESEKPAATLRAYVGEDASNIISSVQQRARARSIAGSGIHARRPSLPNGTSPNQYMSDDEASRMQRVDPQGAAGRMIAAGMGRPFAQVAATGSAIA